MTITEIVEAVSARNDVKGKTYFLTQSEYDEMKDLDFPTELEDGRKAEINSAKMALIVTGRRKKKKPTQVTPAKEETTPAKKDAIMWVGIIAYPTIESFYEKTKDGLSLELRKKYESALSPKGRIYLAHNEGFKGKGVIIGYISMGAIEDKKDSEKVHLKGKVTKTEFYDISGWTQRKGLFAFSREDTKGMKVTTAPHERSDVKVNLKSNGIKSRWTEDEVNLLNKLVKNHGRAQGVREFAVASGRGVHAIEYKYNKMRLHAKYHPEG